MLAFCLSQNHEIFLLVPYLPYDFAFVFFDYTNVLNSYVVMFINFVMASGLFDYP